MKTKTLTKLYAGIFLLFVILGVVAPTKTVQAKEKIIEISSAKEWNEWINMDVTTASLSKGVSAKLTKDINFHGKRVESAYMGPSDVFDGGGHTMSNFVIDSKKSGGGLFFRNFGGTIKNLCVKNATILEREPSWDKNYKKWVNPIEFGGICAYNETGTIDHCIVDGFKIRIEKEKIASDNRHVGGIAGYNAAGKIINCANLSDINIDRKKGGSVYVGGIAGRNQGRVEIYNCYNLGNISGNSDKTHGVISPIPERGAVGEKVVAAGIVVPLGPAHPDSRIMNCYDLGKVSAGCDEIYAATAASVLPEYVNRQDYIPFNGERPLERKSGFDRSIVTNCYYPNGNAVDDVNSDRTKALDPGYMKSKAFVNLLNSNLPKGGKKWTQGKNGYPTLWP